MKRERGAGVVRNTYQYACIASPRCDVFVICPSCVALSGAMTAPVRTMDIEPHSSGEARKNAHILDL